MKEDKKTGNLIMALVMFFSMGLFFGFFIGAGSIESKWRSEALAHGAAYWQVNPDGSTEFKWKEAGK